MDKSQSWSSKESENSTNSWTEESSDETKDSSENISDLNKRLEASLYIGEKHESKSPELKSNEECNVPQDLDFQYSRLTMLSKQSFSKETELLPDESDPIKCEIPIKTVNRNSFSLIKSKVDSKNAEKLQPPFCSGGSSTSRRSYSHPKAQCFPSSVPTQNLSGYHPNVNPEILPRSTNSIENEASAYSRQYPEESLSEENIVYKQMEDGLFSQCLTEMSVMCQSQNKANTSQSVLPAKHATYSSSLQIPLSNITTVVEPVVSSSQSRKAFLNSMPSNCMNAAPLSNVQDSSQYQTPSPPIKTNSIPMQYSKRSFYYRKQIPSRRANAETMPHGEPSRATISNIPNISERISKPKNVLQSRIELTPKISDQFSTLPSIQPQPRVHYSKNNFFNFQGAPIQFPSPIGSNSFGSRFVERQEVIPRQYIGACASNSYSFIPPVVRNKVVPFPATQCNVHIQYVSHAYNPIQLAILAKNIASFREHNQLAMQSPMAAQQYQNPNQPVFQHGLQYKSTLRNLTTETNNWDPNQPVNPCGTLSQPALQNLTAIHQYPHPNHTMHQYETQSVLQSLAPTPQYRDPIHPTYQYGMLHRPLGQNLFAVSQYQNPNLLNNQYGMLHQPFGQNVFAVSQYQDPNLLNNQYGILHQPSSQNLSAVSQYQDPNHSMYQYEKQYEYQPPFQNFPASLQYQNPDQPMDQYGKQTSLKTSYPINASYVIYDKSIPPPNDNSNIVPWQTYATNMTLNNIVKNPPLPYRNGDPSYPFTGDPSYQFTSDPNFVSNVSDVQTSAEYSSSTSMSHYFLLPDTTMGSINQNLLEDASQDSNLYERFLSIENPDKFGTNIYPTWSVSTCDPHEEIILNEVYKT